MTRRDFIRSATSYSLFLSLFVLSVSCFTPGRWNDAHIKWYDYSTAMQLGKLQNKPIFMLIHKTYCSPCKILDESLRRSAEFEVLSEYFIMANVEDEDEPLDAKYAVQGSYNPRILFLYPNGDVADIVSEQGDPQHIHHYTDVDHIVSAMLRAMRLMLGVSDVGQL